MTPMRGCALMKPACLTTPAHGRITTWMSQIRHACTDPLGQCHHQTCSCRPTHLGAGCQMYYATGQSPSAASVLPKSCRAMLRDVPIAAVARRCGFTNGSYFSKRFKTMYGLSPRAWRQMSSGERPQDSVSANPPA
ncbi:MULTISPECIES: helix-turn-helix domain-containing protein [Actinomycetes]|uniref:helix-turn-helix domain-containing protein n=1 Tax=Actinomycetes TaxID=1760 RepID=UPI0009DCAA09